MGGVWGVECGVWGVGCGVWGVGFGVWGVGGVAYPQEIALPSQHRPSVQPDLGLSL